MTTCYNSHETQNSTIGHRRALAGNPRDRPQSRPGRHREGGILRRRFCGGICGQKGPHDSLVAPEKYGRIGASVRAGIGAVGGKVGYDNEVRLSTNKLTRLHER